MHIRGTLPVLLLILTISFSGCSSGNSSGPNISAVYSVAGGNATYSYEVAIDEDGGIRRTITDEFTQQTTVRSGYLNGPDKDQFHTLVLDANVFALDDTYRCTVNCPTDMPLHTLAVSIAGNNKTISFDLSPTDNVLALTQKIDDLANKL